MSNKQQIEFMAGLYAVEKFYGPDESYFSLKSRIAKAADYKTFSPEALDIMTHVQVMDWLSNCFVRIAGGDVVAAITTVDSQIKNQVIFHISNNNGNKISDGDRKCASSFIRRLDNLKASNISDVNNVRLGIQGLLEHIMEFCWPRILRKLTFVRDAEGNDKSGNKVNIKFSELVDRLLKEERFLQEHFRTKKEKTETTEVFLKKQMQKLKTELEDLIKDITEVNTRHLKANLKDEKKRVEYSISKKLEDYEKAALRCETILFTLDSVMGKDTILFKIVNTDKEEEIKEKKRLNTFAMKIHNRLSRIIKYKAGAQLFITRSLQDFKKASRADKVSDIAFKIEWVGDYITAYGLPNDGDREEFDRERFETWLQKTKNSLKDQGEEVDEASYELLRTTILSAYSDQKKTIRLYPTLHCELAMMHYCDVRAIIPLHNVIGVSKLNCWSCNTYSERYNKDLDEKTGREYDRYVMKGKSGKAHHNWFIPRTAGVRKSARNLKPRIHVQLAIESSSQNVVEIAHDRLLKILILNVNAPSESVVVGSDSSSGSETIMLLLDQLLL